MRDQINPSMGAREWALLLLLSILWGGSFFFTEVALHEIAPLTLVVGRVGIAALALVVLIHVRGQRLPADPRLWAAFMVMAVLNNVIPFSLITFGQTAISGSLASILNATTPLFTVLLAHVLTRDERLTPARLGGVFLGLVGVVVLVGPSALASLGIDARAQLAVLAAALSYAFAGIFGRRFRGTSPLATAAGQLLCSTALMLPIAALVETPWRGAMPGAATWAAVIGIALLSTAIAYLIYFRLLASAGATNLLLVTFLIPISAILLGTTFLGERIGLAEVAGMALIGLGLAAIDGRAVRELARHWAAKGVVAASK